jgi:hypothetical protein
VPDAGGIQAQLRAHGERRRHALDEAAMELEQVLQLVPSALDAGITVREISQLGEVSRPTLYGRVPELQPRR